MTTPRTTPRRSIPFREIRALCPSPDTIVLYQAYNSTIADAAVKHQRLNASDKFSKTRMTWFKPSWCWMLYRCGYSYKDAGQERVLAIEVRKDWLFTALAQATVNDHDGPKADPAPSRESMLAARVSKDRRIQVQWDPERSPRIGKLNYRSIQIGVPGALAADMVENGIVCIDDVTERARRLKAVLDESARVTNSELEEMGLLPVEPPLEVPEAVYSKLRMDVKGET